jgi:hypothetical protein
MPPAGPLWGELLMWSDYRAAILESGLEYIGRCTWGATAVSSGENRVKAGKTGFSNVASADFQNDLAEVFSFQHQTICVRSFFHGQNVTDHRTEFVLRGPVRKLQPCFPHQ